MTREEFNSLKVGDRIIHAFGGIGVVTEKDESRPSAAEGQSLPRLQASNAKSERKPLKAIRQEN